MPDPRDLDMACDLLDHASTHSAQPSVRSINASVGLCSAHLQSGDDRLCHHLSHECTAFDGSPIDPLMCQAMFVRVQLTGVYEISFRNPYMGRWLRVSNRRLQLLFAICTSRVQGCYDKYNCHIGSHTRTHTHVHFVAASSLHPS